MLPPTFLYASDLDQLDLFPIYFVSASISIIVMKSKINKHHVSRGMMVHFIMTKDIISSYVEQLKTIPKPAGPS